MKKPSATALEKAIDADPESLDSWAVYADWLQANGDVRGELAAVQLGLAKDPKKKDLLAAEKKLLKQHAEALIGPWAKYLCRSGKGDLPSLTRKPDLGPDHRPDESEAAPIRVTWRAGFITHACVGHPGMDWTSGFGNEKTAAADDGDDDDDDDGDGEDYSNVDTGKLLGQVLSSPVARFLTSLTLGMPNNPEDGEMEYAGMLKALAAHPAAKRITKLYIGDIVYEDAMISSIQTDKLGKHLAALPQLRALTVRGRVDLGKSLALPELRELTLLTGSLDKSDLGAVLAAKLPKLVKLDISFGRQSYGANTTLKDLKKLLDATVLASVKHLGLRNTEWSDELAAALPTAKIVKQLEVLDLSEGTMTDAGAQALAAGGKAVFGHLRKIDVSDNYLGKPGEKAIGAINAQVRTKPQRTPYTSSDNTVYRYPVLGE